MPFTSPTRPAEPRPHVQRRAGETLAEYYVRSCPDWQGEGPCPACEHEARQEPDTLAQELERYPRRPGETPAAWRARVRRIQQAAELAVQLAAQQEPHVDRQFHINHPDNVEPLTPTKTVWERLEEDDI